jgi:two-component system response regulator NreC
MIDLFIADDHPLVRNGLIEVLQKEKEFRFLGFAENGIEAFEAIKKIKPKVALLDVDMPGMSGLEVLSKLQVTSETATVNVIILTMHEDVALLNKAMRMGAKSYLLKTVKPSVLVEVIHKVAGGDPYYLPETLTTIIDASTVVPNKASTGKEPTNDAVRLASLLSERETEVLTLIAEGFTNAQIGEKIHISPRTVDTHRTNIMKKLEVGNVASLVRIALINGLVE